MGEKNGRLDCSKRMLFNKHMESIQEVESVKEAEPVKGMEFNSSWEFNKNYNGAEASVTFNIETVDLTGKSFRGYVYLNCVNIFTTETVGSVPEAATSAVGFLKNLADAVNALLGAEAKL